MARRAFSMARCQGARSSQDIELDPVSIEQGTEGATSRFARKGCSPGRVTRYLGEPATGHWGSHPLRQGCLRRIQFRH